MDSALYGESGFYSAGGRAGRRGDFLTSPEVGPLFGVVGARALDAEWERLGRPTDFTVVDADSLKPLERVTGPARVIAAARLGRTRLIDNLAV